MGSVGVWGNCGLWPNKISMGRGHGPSSSLPPCHRFCFSRCFLHWFVNPWKFISWAVLYHFVQFPGALGVLKNSWKCCKSHHFWGFGPFWTGSLFKLLSGSAFFHIVAIVLMKSEDFESQLGSRRGAPDRINLLFFEPWEPRWPWGACDKGSWRAWCLTRADLKWFVYSFYRIIINFS